MKPTVQIKLFATLKKLTPDTADNFPIKSGATVQDILEQMGVPIKQAKLIFINSKKGALSSMLQGGERIGIFPPIGGG